MVTITARMDDLEELVGSKLPRDSEQLSELLYSIKCELSGLSKSQQISDDMELQIEDKDTNRPDIWSPEGIARALKGIQGREVGIKRYSVAGKPAVEISVDEKLEGIRPYIACAIARHPRVSDTVIRGLIQLQEKLDQSYGRRRRRSSIGFYDFDLITPPLKYGTAKMDEIRFVPLQWDMPLTLREILEKHPKGLEYGYIVNQHEDMPILLDSKGKVLSFPPIINSNDLGRVTAETKNLLVEITGTSEETVTNALTILTTALADRGAEICPAVIHYPYGKNRTVTTPVLDERRIDIPLNDMKRLIGTDLERSEITSLLRRARYDVEDFHDGKLKVLIPCYRMDILHPVDVMEDVAIAYGLNNMKPRWPSDITIGGLSTIEEFSDNVRELMIGLGFQEVLTFMMTNHERLFERMNVQPDTVIDIANPKIMTMTCLRSWLLPSLMDFLSNNTHIEYPQRIYEVGDCTIWDPTLPTRARDVRKLACVSAHAKANFTEMKSYLEPLMVNLGLEFSLKPKTHSSFMEGRVGSILLADREVVGVIGEIHPQVIENWKLEDPVAALEIDLNKVFEILHA
jgi:phenylalanyl-tRNA synthetase beta chain